MEVHGLEEDVSESVISSEVVKSFLFRNEEAIESLLLHEFESALLSLLKLFFGEMKCLFERLGLLQDGHFEFLCKANARRMD